MVEKHFNNEIAPVRSRGGSLVSDKYGSNCLETMTQPNDYILEGGASNQVQRIIDQKFFLKSDINFIRQFFYQTDFNQSANANLKPRNRCVF
jgi:hypothetical protein